MAEENKACPFCDEYFSIDKFQEHIDFEHLKITNCSIQINSKFQCNFCPAKFTAMSSFRKHIAAIHQTKSNKNFTEKGVKVCELCDKTFSSEKLYQSHVELVHSKAEKCVISKNETNLKSCYKCDKYMGFSFHEQNQHDVSTHLVL